MGRVFEGAACDGFRFNRRQALANGGYSSISFLIGESAFGSSTPEATKSLIIIYLSGGLAHQDSFDPKPKAPAEIRGEFQSITTRLPGIRFSEHLPRLAARNDKFSIIRSLVGFVDEHSSYQNLTGFPMALAKKEGKPHIGSIVARALGTANGTTPPFVDLFPVMQHRPYNSPGPGSLGTANMGARLDAGDLGPMKVSPEMMDSIRGRESLSKQIDSINPSYGNDFKIPYSKAFNLLITQSLSKTLNIEHESQKLVDRYGRGDPKHQGDGAPLWNDQLILARRLVEAGARVVTIAYGFWDTHGNNFKHLKSNLPVFDQGISALLDDLSERGLLETTTVLVCGEFGRTPKINKDAGRDHWARVNTCLLAGGLIKPGIVLGSTDSHAAEVHDNPVHHRDVLATVLNSIGLDLEKPIQDVEGRPVSPLPGTAKPIEKILNA